MADVSVPSVAWLRWHTDNGWKVERTLKARWKGRELVVRSGFKTDLASIPRLFQSVVPKVARHVIPAIFHDAACEGRLGLSRSDADRMFLDFMAASGVGFFRRRAMYGAVRGYALLTGKD